MNGARAVRVRIKGQVQGVFFRAWTKEQADTLGVMGWVRNRLDGDVEALFVGQEDAVVEMLRLIGKGPTGAKVDEVRVELARALTAAGFHVKPTV